MLYKERKPVKEFHELKLTYYLHQLYLEDYKDNNEYINLSKVINYINWNTKIITHYKLFLINIINPNRK